jgi:nucleoside-diphosphate-sugar epimerase
MEENIISADERVLVTGAAGFIGYYVVAELLKRGFRNINCLVRPSGGSRRISELTQAYPDSKVQIVQGNLLNPDDCRKATEGVRVIYHLAAGRDKSFAGSFMNSAVATRNLLDGARASGTLRRFVCVSSFAVYSNRGMRRGAPLDETCAIESDPHARYEAYTFGKLKQEQILVKYGNQYHIPYVILRPGNVFGPGKRELPGRIGIDTFGVFLHLGGRNRIPFTYVENCAEAIVLAGIRPGIDGEVFNVVDDNLPTSAQFLRWYKRNVHHFLSIRIPYGLAYLLSLLWEWYSRWSDGQIPPAFNVKGCQAFWKGNRYPNAKLKQLVGWSPRVPIREAAALYFRSVRGEA